MSKVTEYREIRLDELVIGKAQARNFQTGQGIEDLANSIEVQGLLQPILVCAATERGKWEILIGQRRYLAYQMLNLPTITAGIIDERVDIGEAKAISITENLLRHALSGPDLKDGIVYLYNRYGSVKDVHQKTGLPLDKIRAYVKYDRLEPAVCALVDEGTVDINAAVKAQDTAERRAGKPDPESAVRLAKSMKPMTGEQRKRVAKDIEHHPDKPIEDALEDARTTNFIQVVATVSATTHDAIRAFAKSEDLNQDDALVSLIEESLMGRGLLSE